MATELVFNTKDLSEDAIAIYICGIEDALDTLGIDFEWDETSPDLAEFRVRLSEQGEKAYRFAQDLISADIQQAQAEVEEDENG